MTFSRGCFLGGSTAALVAASGIVRPAGAEQKFGPHVHGINGTKLNLHTHYDLKTRILDGPDWQLASARGSVVFFNMFATWCPPCRAEAPALVAFADAHPEATVISVDVREPDDTVRAFRKKFGITYPIGMDGNGGFFSNLGCPGYPTTFIFRPDGRLSCAFVGDADLAALEEELRYALDPDRDATPSPSPSPARSPVTPA